MSAEYIKMKSGTKDN